ncbi:MAG: hypothetical protein JRJ40_09825 [Deltaproteobacteria bacterium]|nr:hypothetical protein [Deltaproteobacteria bacterium]
MKRSRRACRPSSERWRVPVPANVSEVITGVFSTHWLSSQENHPFRS